MTPFPSAKYLILPSRRPLAISLIRHRVKKYIVNYTPCSFVKPIIIYWTGPLLRAQTASTAQQCNKNTGIGFDPTDVNRLPDISTALKTLGQYPSRIDPIKVFLFFFDWTNCYTKCKRLDVADTSRWYSSATIGAISSPKCSILRCWSTTIAVIARTPLCRTLAGDHT